MDRRVVIAGLGITSNLGHDLDQVSQSLRQGKSSIIADDQRNKLGFRSPLRAELPPDNPRYKIERRKRKFMSEVSLYCALTWVKTIDQCALDPAHFTGTKVGVVVGNDSTSEPLKQVLEIMDEYKETHFLGSGMVIKNMNSTCSMNLGTLVGAQGINLTLSAACASGAHAVGYGYYLIRSGLQDAVITGGFQEMHWLSMASFDALGAFSTCSDPQKASKPFDHRRDGLVPGGGGAIVILESLERAERLGHRIYGEIAGYGFSSDGAHLTLPSGDGAERAIIAAIQDAEISASDIDYINAHATSTPAGDRVEASVIHKLFGDKGPPVSSTKSMTGHECWMGGASEIVYSCIMMRDGFIAPNINFEQQEDQAKKINIINKTIEESPRTILSNSFGFGGTNAAVILKDFD